MASRLELHRELEAIPGVKKVYYQPPASIHLEYPCIIYHRNAGYTPKADNLSYFHVRGYDVTVISSDPDCDICDYILMNYDYVKFSRTAMVSNLSHWYLTLYY